MSGYTCEMLCCYCTLGVRRERTTVLNIFNDHDYNRSVITMVSSIDSISKYLILMILFFLKTSLPYKNVRLVFLLLSQGWS